MTENPFAKIDADITAQKKHEQAEAAKKEAQDKLREAWAEKGMSEFVKLRDALFSKITSQAANAKVDKQTLTFGDAFLHLHAKKIHTDTVVGDWSCIAAGTVKVRQTSNPQFEWSASVWYTDRGEGSEAYRWVQLSFMSHPLYRSDNYGPVSADPSSNIAQQALSPAMGVAQLAERPKDVRFRDKDWFEDIWIERLTRAAKGELTRPGHMPFENVA